MSGKESQTERVSALIPAWNAGVTISRCIKAIKAQEPAVMEVLVADDGSTDDTARLAVEAGARVINLGGRKGICAGRNRLLREAKGELVWFVDSDSFAEPDCLHRLLNARKEYPDAGLVHGSNVLPPGFASWSNTAYAVLGRHDFLLTTTPRYTSHVTTANCIMPRQLAMDAGLFRHFRAVDLICDYYEDMDLALRARKLGARCRFVPDAVTMHENPRRSISSFLRHRVKCGICSTIVRRRHLETVSFGPVYAGSPWLLFPLAPAIALYSALKAIYIHIHYREISQLMVVAAIPLILFGQVFYAYGVLRGAFWDHAGRFTEEQP